jgi:anti-sigma B factor antagonist
MEWQRETTAPVPVVHIVGRFDRMDMSVTETDVDALLHNGSRHVVIDLSQASFMDSYGLAMLVKIMKVCRQRGGYLLLAAEPATMCSIFKVTRLDRVFTLYPDTTTARAATA